MSGLATDSPIAPPAAACEDNAGSQVIKNSKWNVLAWLCLLVLGFVSAPIMVQHLGKDLYGILGLMAALIAPLGLMDLGMGEATIKYVSESLGQGNETAAERYIRTTAFFNVVVGVGGMILIAGLAPSLVRHAFSIEPAHQALAVKCMYLTSSIWASNQIRQTFVGAIAARQDYRTVSVGMFFTQFFNTSAALIALLLGSSLWGMILVQAIVAAGSVFAWRILARRALPRMRFFPKYDRETLRRTFHFGFWQTLNNLCGMLTHQGQRWLLGALLPVASVGFYNVGSQLVTMVYSAGYRVGQVLFPAISQLQGQQRDEQGARLALQANWALTSFVVSAYVALTIFAHEFLRLWIGADFAQHVAAPLRILSLGYAVASIFAIPSFYLLGTGRPQWLTYLAIGQAIVTLSLAYPFVVMWGVTGAAAAVACGTVVPAIGVGAMWAPCFKPWIGFGTYFAANFGPLLSAVVVGGVLYRFSAMVTTGLTWFSLGALSLCTALITWASIQLVNLLLPGGINRWAVLRDVVVARVRMPGWRTQAQIGDQASN